MKKRLLFMTIVGLLTLSMVTQAFNTLNDRKKGAQTAKERDSIYYQSTLGFLVEKLGTDSIVGYSLKVPYNEDIFERKVWSVSNNDLLATFEVYNKKMKNEFREVEAVLEIKNGKYTEWYPDGAKKIECVYKENKLNGEFKQYYPHGGTKRVEHWKDGEWQDGKCYDENGNETDYCAYQQMAEFNGGVTALFRFLGNNVRYPVQAQSKGIEGRVIIQFVVNVDGSLSNIQVVKKANQYLDAEAVRVVNSMPIWKPGLLEGKPVRMKFTLPVNFKLR